MIESKREASMLKKELERKSLDEWVDEFARANLGLWKDLDSASAWLRFVEHATTSIAELVRTEKHNELIEALGFAFGWLYCFIKFYSESRPKEHFRFLSPLSEMIWRKYPGVCYRCTHKFTKEELVKKDYLACVCLATPEPSDEEKQIRKECLELTRKNKHKPATIDEWADMIKAIYGPNHHELSLSAICLHFLEEVGEVAKGLRMLRKLTPIVETDVRQKIVELEDEIADVFSWILGLLNKLDQILEKSREYYKSSAGVELSAIKASIVAINALQKWGEQTIP